MLTAGGSKVIAKGHTLNKESSIPKGGVINRLLSSVQEWCVGRRVKRILRLLEQTGMTRSGKVAKDIPGFRVHQAFFFFKPRTITNAHVKREILLTEIIYYGKEGHILNESKSRCGASLRQAKMPPFTWSGRIGIDAVLVPAWGHCSGLHSTQRRLVRAARMIRRGSPMRQSPLAEIVDAVGIAASTCLYVRREVSIALVHS